VRAIAAALSGALPVEQIDAAIADWRTTGLSRAATRDAIFEAIATNLHLGSLRAGVLIMAAGLAVTSGVAEALREHAEAGDLRITYTIEHYAAEASGKPMIDAAELIRWRRKFGLVAVRCVLLKRLPVRMKCRT
jgi:hypothetical protein